MERCEYNLNWHELRVLGTNGRIFRLKVADMVHVVSSRLFLFSIVLFATLIALIDQQLFDVDLILPWRLVYWNLMAFFATALWLGFFAAGFAVKRWVRRDLVIPSAVLILAAVTILILVNYVIGSSLLGRTDLWQRPIGQEILRYALIALVFETMSATFLMPVFMDRLERRAARQVAALATGDRDAAVVIKAPRTAADDSARVKPQTRPAAKDARFIRHQGKAIDLTRLLYMKSVEHYVELVTRERTDLVRASLRELTALCPPCQGVRPHRSYWVHRDAIVGLNRSGGGKSLVLSDGSEIPVARNRRADVGHWLSAHVPKKRPER